MHNENKSKVGLDAYLRELKSILEHQDVIEKNFGDFTKFDLLSTNDFEVDKEFVSNLALRMEKLNLYSEPRIKKGIIKRAIDSRLILYSGISAVDHQSKSYKTGLLLLRVAVLMARIDGAATDEELEAIKNLIWSMAILSTTEKRCLYAKAIYLFSSNHKYDEQARDYVRAVLNRENLIEKIELLSQSAAGRLLTIVKDVAIADGFIHKSELTLLQDIYRALGLPARSAKPDVEKYAAERFVDLETREITDYATEDELEEFDDLLGDLLLDY